MTIFPLGIWLQLIYMTMGSASSTKNYWAGLVSTTYSEPGVMGQHVIPALEEFFYPKGSSQSTCVNVLPPKEFSHTGTLSSVFTFQGAYLFLWKNWELTLDFWRRRFIKINILRSAWLLYSTGTWAFSWTLMSLKSRTLRISQTLGMRSYFYCFSIRVDIQY